MLCHKLFHGLYQHSPIRIGIGQRKDQIGIFQTGQGGEQFLHLGGSSAGFKRDVVAEHAQRIARRCG